MPHIEIHIYKDDNYYIKVEMYAIVAAAPLASTFYFQSPTACANFIIQLNRMANVNYLFYDQELADILSNFVNIIYK